MKTRYVESALHLSFPPRSLFFLVGQTSLKNDPSRTNPKCAPYDASLALFIDRLSKSGLKLNLETFPDQCVVAKLPINDNYEYLAIDVVNYLLFEQILSKIKAIIE